MTMAPFDYELPPERIAAAPARPRDHARLLHVTANALDDRIVLDLPTLLRAGDCLVVNDTRVIPAQLSGRRGNARIGITLDRPLADGTWRVLLRNARRARPGETIDINGSDGFSALVVERSDDGSGTLRFNRAGAAFDAALAIAGALALPPYIPRPSGNTKADTTDYQTMFAARDGAVAAPTAGLHFTDTLLEALSARDVQLARVTLHVGAGTFLPVRDANIENHRMHTERGDISADTAAVLNRTRADGGRIVAVGTTSLRVLETASAATGRIEAWNGETDLFIRPGYQFRAVDLLMTNFHLPRSTLLMLVSAFAGTERIQSAYAHAIASCYRFYSFGDACLLEPA